MSFSQIKGKQELVLRLITVVSMFLCSINEYTGAFEYCIANYTECTFTKLMVASCDSCLMHSLTETTYRDGSNYRPLIVGGKYTGTPDNGGEVSSR